MPKGRRRLVAATLGVVIIALAAAWWTLPYRSPMFDDLRKIATRIEKDTAAYTLVPNGGGAQPPELLVSETLSFDRPSAEIKQLALRLLSGWTVDDSQPDLMTMWTDSDGGAVESATGLWDLKEVLGALPNEKCSIVIRYRPNWLDRALFKLGI